MVEILPFQGLIYNKDMVRDISKVVSPPYDVISKDTRKKLDEICDVFESEGVKADAHVYIGESDEEIEKAAREHQASMIVLGSSGKTAWVERWLGSTPQSIAEKSIYPTLLIPFEQK